MKNLIVFSLKNSYLLWNVPSVSRLYVYNLKGGAARGDAEKLRVRKLLSMRDILTYNFHSLTCILFYIQKLIYLDV